MFTFLTILEQRLKTKEISFKQDLKNYDIQH